MKQDFFKDDRPFNMAVAFLERSHLLFMKANETSVVGEYAVWYRVLMALKRAISFKLDEEEKTKIKEKLESISNSLPLKNTSPKLEKELDELETYIIELMYKYELYYPKYEKKDWQEVAQEEDV